MARVGCHRSIHIEMNLTARDLNPRGAEALAMIRAGVPGERERREISRVGASRSFRGDGGVNVLQETTMCGSTFALRNTEGYRSSQTEIIALSLSSKAEPGTGPRFTPKRPGRS